MPEGYDGSIHPPRSGRLALHLGVRFEITGCHEQGMSNPSFVLIVLAPGCGTEVKRRGERSGRSASNGRIAGDVGGNLSTLLLLR